MLDICTHFMELQDPRMNCFGIFVEDVNDVVCSARGVSWGWESESGSGVGLVCRRVLPSSLPV